MTGHGLQSKKYIRWKAFLPGQYRWIGEPKYPIANLSKRDIGLLIVIDCNTSKARIPGRYRHEASVPERPGPIDLERLTV